MAYRSGAYDGQGQYYYGPVAGGQLSTAYAADAFSHGSMQILSEPARIGGVATEAGEVRLAIDSLPVHASNRVMRSTAADGDDWQPRGELPPGVESTAWSESPAGAAAAFYRVESR